MFPKNRNRRFADTCQSAFKCDVRPRNRGATLVYYLTLECCRIGSLCRGISCCNEQSQCEPTEAANHSNPLTTKSGARTFALTLIPDERYYHTSSGRAFQRTFTYRTRKPKATGGWRHRRIRSRVRHTPRLRC